MNQDLREYILNFYRYLMTPSESQADKNCQYVTKTGGEGLQFEMMKRRGWVRSDDAIKALLADGPEIFYQRVAQRIWDESRDKVYLNLCPNCQRLARTPSARQCRFCGHDWH